MAAQKGTPCAICGAPASIIIASRERGSFDLCYEHEDLYYDRAAFDAALERIAK